MKAESTESAGAAGGETASRVNARQQGGMALASFASRSVSGPAKIGFQQARYVPLSAVNPGRNCCRAASAPAKRRAVAQNTRSLPTTTPDASVCLPIQAHRISTVCAADRGITITVQGVNMLGA